MREESRLCGEHEAGESFMNWWDGPIGRGKHEQVLPGKQCG